jgi:DNA modification methylase
MGASDRGIMEKEKGKGKGKGNERYYTMRNLEWLHSVWRIPTVNPFFLKYDVKADKFNIDIHIAPFPEDLAFRLIVLYSRKGYNVLDPFCGSGTTNYAALAMFRKTIGYEIEQKYINAAKERCGDRAAFYNKSSESMAEIPNDSIQLTITSPPYLNLRRYSGKKENIGNMEDPFPSLMKVFQEVYRVTKPNCFFCVNVSDVIDPKTGLLTDFPYKVLDICKAAGFKHKSTIIWDKGLTLSESFISRRRMFFNHEYVWIMKK